MRQVAISSDGPIFGQSGRSSLPPMFIPMEGILGEQNTKMQIESLAYSKIPADVQRKLPC